MFIIDKLSNHGFILCVLLLKISVADAFFWGWMESSKNTPLSKNDEFSEISKVTVTFGLSTTDEKFLQEAKKFETTNEESDVSGELAECHKRLILSLKQDCSKMSEEQIGKMAVNLLNCQNAIEKRPHFRCTTKMPLADCTRGMDGNMWTVYQLMTNRALAVCHSVSQRLFRMKTEMLVNHLSIASQGQLGNLEEMHGWHLKLQDLQSSAQSQINAMNEQHDAMVATQQRLLEKQKSLEMTLNENAVKIAEDQRVLQDGGTGLLHLTSQVKEQLDATVSEVQHQEELLKNQRSMMDATLSTYEKSFRNLIDELNSKGESLLSAQDAAYLKVQASLDGMDRVNKSLGSLGMILMTAQEIATEKMSLLQAFLARSEVTTDEALLCFAHLAILIIVMLISSFLQFPLLTRLFILFFVPFNIYLRISLHYYVSLSEIASGFGAVFLTELLLFTMNRRNSKKSTFSKQDVDKLIETIQTMEQRINDIVLVQSPSKKDEFAMPFSPPPYERERSYASHVLQSAIQHDWDRLSIAASDISSSLASMSEKQRCNGTTRDGVQCKRMTSSGLCSTHRKSSVKSIKR